MQNKTCSKTARSDIQLAFVISFHRSPVFSTVDAENLFFYHGVNNTECEFGRKFHVF